MKILQIIHASQLRGAEIFACQLSEHLTSFGNEVMIVALYDRNAEMPTKLSVHHLNINNALDIKALSGLAKLVTEERFDIVQTNAGDALKFASLSKMLFRWKAKLVVRNATTMSELIRHRLHRYSYNLLFRVVDKVISVSQHEAEDIKKLFPACINKTMTIPIGIEMPVIDRDEMRRKKNVLLHVAAFNREKNHIGLIRIFSDVLKKINDAELWLAGEGPLLEDVRDFVMALGIQNHVRFLGRRNDVYSLMQQATAFVLPSLTEGLPGVILESMYAHLPVIAYNVGGISEVVKNDITGWVIRKHDEHSFSQQVLQVLNAPAEKRRLVTENAFELVNNDFNNKHISKRFADVYSSVSSNNRSLRLVP